MREKILIVEDEFIVANDLSMMLERSGYNVTGIAPSVARALELISAEKPSWVLMDIFLQGDKTGIDLAVQLAEMEIPFIFISANTNQTILEAAKATLPYGFLVKPFREKDLLVMLDIARYRHAQSMKYNQRRDQGTELHQQMEQIVHLDTLLTEKTKQLGSILNQIVPFDFLWVSRAQPLSSSRDLNLQQLSANEFTVLPQDHLLSILSVSQRELKSWEPRTVSSTAGVTIFNGYEFRKLRMENTWIRTLSDFFKLSSAIVIEIVSNDEVFQFIFFNKASEHYNASHKLNLNQYRQSLKLMVTSIVYGKDPVIVPQAEVKAKLIPDQQEITADSFKGIIGNSPLLKTVFNHIKLVAPDDTSVLILGDSGTGKERIASVIHQLSPRKDKPFITVNCAALPLSLLESELFGHEKGAFTGANDRRIGKFEQADGGSIFLDEIGEMPLEAQVKLLRVLQEKEIERLGGTVTRKINVRIIAATNRNLEKEVSEGRLRLDLYYRLNVFPIELPPLRDRKEDIPALVTHFLDKYNKNAYKTISGISVPAMETLVSYDWPGNIRELEHLIERSMLMSAGPEIQEINLPANNTRTLSQQPEPSRIKTMEEMERDHILSILKLCKGKIFGPGGAAEVLNLPSTTLNSKIKKLGIKFEFV